MALLQISEPDQPSIPHKKNIAIGIDLGTTNSLVATIKDNEAFIFTDSNNKKLIPSVVHYAKDKTQIGEIALESRVSDPSNTIISIKRFMGKTLADISSSNHAYPYNFSKNALQTISIATNQGIKNPIQISADILKHLKQLAITNLGEEIDGAVITVPAYFDENQRQSTKQAAELAGIKVLRLLNEPTAAAIAYGLETKNTGIFLVYDLGGGTLDVSILRLNKGIFEVLAVSGNTYLGGDDFDQLIYQDIIKQLNLNNLNHSDNAKILNQAKKIKEELSNQDLVNIVLQIHNQKHSYTITRSNFYTLSNTLVQTALIPIKKALRDAKLQTNEINEIVMVGGSTRMPNIRNAITEYFNKPVLTNIDPDLVVAIGAAMQADGLVGNQKDDWLLLDVTPLSLGIETMGGLVEKIIPRNSTLPITKAQDFTTYQDGQTAMTIHVVQGEREKISDCRSLAKFSLKNIPPMNAGAARIRITFQIDADGLLSVSATEQTTGVKSSIEIKPSFGLTDKQIANMLQDSITHAVEDVHERQLTEAIIDAKSLITTLNNSLKQHNDLLDIKELEQIRQKISDLNSLINQTIKGTSKASQIKESTTQLNTLTQVFANKIMDKILKRGLQGKDIDLI